MLSQRSKRGQTGGLVSGLVMGIAGLVIGVIIALVVTSTLDTSGLLTTDSAEDKTVGNLTSNFTAGIDQVAAKIPTVLKIAAVVLIIGILAILVGVWQRMRMGGSSI